MAVVEVSITPLGTGTPGVSEYVAGCIRVLRETGLKYQLTSMGTIIEGDVGEVLEVVRRMHEEPFAAGANRISTLIKIDDRRDKEGHTIESKVSAVSEKL